MEFSMLLQRTTLGISGMHPQLKVFATPLFLYWRLKLAVEVGNSLGFSAIATINFIRGLPLSRRRGLAQFCAFVPF